MASLTRWRPAHRRQGRTWPALRRSWLPGALEMIEEQKGGLQAMVDKLSASGLGEQVKSWVGPGPTWR